MSTKSCYIALIGYILKVPLFGIEKPKHFDVLWPLLNCKNENMDKNYEPCSKFQSNPVLASSEYWLVLNGASLFFSTFFQIVLRHFLSRLKFFQRIFNSFITNHN